MTYSIRILYAGENNEFLTETEAVLIKEFLLRVYVDENVASLIKIEAGSMTEIPSTYALLKVMRL